MGRPKKIKPEEPVIEDGIEVPVQVEKPEAKQDLSLTARFKVIDKDGTKTYPEFKSTGSTVEELLSGLEFPKGVNALVEVTLNAGTKTVTKALAPHRARLILEYQNKIKAAETFRASFRGIV